MAETWRSWMTKLQRIAVLFAYKVGWLSTVDPDLIRAYLAHGPHDTDKLHKNKHE